MSAMNLRFAAVVLSVLALGAALTTSCSSQDKEEENASIVNVEKGVAPAMSTPQLPETASAATEQPVGIIAGSEQTAAPQPDMENEQPEAQAEVEKKAAEE